LRRRGVSALGLVKMKAASLALDVQALSPALAVDGEAQLE
jgi:hypothetical protein